MTFTIRERVLKASYCTKAEKTKQRVSRYRFPQLQSSQIISAYLIRVRHIIGHHSSAYFLSASLIVCNYDFLVLSFSYSYATQFGCIELLPRLVLETVQSFNNATIMFLFTFMWKTSVTGYSHQMPNCSGSFLCLSKILAVFGS